MSLQAGLRRVGRFVERRHWWVIAAWISALLCLRSIAPDWDMVAIDGDLKHLPDSTTTARGAILNAAAFPGDRAKSQIVVVFVRHSEPLTIADRELALRVASRFEELDEPTLVDIWTEKTPIVGPQLQSPSGHATRVVMRLTNEFMATDNIRLLKRTEEIVDAARKEASTGLQLGISGVAAIGGDMLTAAAESVTSTHRTTILLVTLVLILIYRSPWLVLVPLFTIGVASSTSLDLLSILAGWTLNHPDSWLTIRVFTTTKIFVIVLLFGAGTDYCLFLTARFRELRSGGDQQHVAIAKAVEHVGLALVASALTTIVGLAMMGWAEFGKFTYSGPAIAICLAVTLLASLTLVPALLATRLGKHEARPKANEDSRLWTWLANAILRQPGRILLASLVLAVPLAYRGWSVGVTYDLLGELPADRVTRQGTKLLQANFPPGEIGPLVVLAKLPEASLVDQDGQYLVAELSKPLYEMPGISSIRSWYQPLGDPPGTVRFSPEGFMELTIKGSPLAKAAFVSESGDLKNKVTRLHLILEDEPFSKEAIETCTEVEKTLVLACQNPNSPWNGASFELIGPTAGIRDLQRITTADRERIQLLVVGAVLLVILALLRRPVVCCYLIATVVLSYLVTMGISDFVFHTLRGDAYLGLDWKVPLFLFVILVAVGQDYNIYLVSRVIEEQARLGEREGLRRALVQTGGIITSCGVIMVGTFISMLTAQMHGVAELGFALSLGILLDTFFVRTILVPAFLAIRLQVASKREPGSEAI